MTIAAFSLDHYDEVLALWQDTPGICVRDADSHAATARYLARNPGCSFVALSDEARLIGSALSGHDGRPGYLQHIVVDPAFRHRGIAHALITRCLDALAAEGIAKMHIDVLTDNNLASAYWLRRGWKRRDNTYRYCLTYSGSENARSFCCARPNR
jgi:ribosomal protein S18 acetylase RimI-like enzyme